MRLLGLRVPLAWRRARRTLAALGVAGLLSVLVGIPAGGPALLGFALLALMLLESGPAAPCYPRERAATTRLIQIRPLLGELPLDFSRWTANPVRVHNAVRLVVETRPSLVVECGSSNSTAVIARCLQALGWGRVISLDHDCGGCPTWLQHARFCWMTPTEWTGGRLRHCGARVLVRRYRTWREGGVAGRCDVKDLH